MLDGLIAKTNCPRTDLGLEVVVLPFLRRGGAWTRGRQKGDSVPSLPFVNGR